MLRHCTTLYRSRHNAIQDYTLHEKDGTLVEGQTPTCLSSCRRHNTPHTYTQRHTKHAHTHIHTHTHTHTDVHIHTHQHVHIRTHTHAHTQRRKTHTKAFDAINTIPLLHNLQLLPAVPELLQCLGASTLAKGPSPLSPTLPWGPSLKVGRNIFVTLAWGPSLQVDTTLCPYPCLHVVPWLISPHVGANFDRRCC